METAAGRVVQRINKVTNIAIIQYRVKFGIPSTSLATKGDSITFSTPTIEGTVLRRNKPDGSGKHPWKAEATEGEKNVPDSVITGWYKSVYEPTFTAKPAETGK